MTIPSSFRQILLRAVWQGGAFLLVAVVLGLTVNQLRPGKLALVADWSPRAQLTLASDDSLAISLDEAEAMFLAQFAVFLDARSREQYSEGHIKGAYSLPWEEFERSTGEVPAGIPPETTVITYCDGESCNLSKELAFALLERGYVNIRVLVNGWSLWKDRKLPVEPGNQDLR
jgi:rhodanese-related sulfurtransferase